MKKIFNVFMTLAMVITAGMTLTSCSDETDNPVVPFNPAGEVTEADLKEALVGLHIDASDFVVGEEALRVWDMRADNTFTAYDLYYDDDLTFVVDTVAGTWKPLANQAVWWDETITDKLQGFTVVYEKELDLPFETDEPDEVFFGFLTEDEDDSDDDDELYFLSAYALNELATLDQEETEENAQARTRAAQYGNTSFEAVNTVGQGLADGVTRQDIASVSNAQKFFDSITNSLNTAGARKFYNPNEARQLFTRENWRDQDIILLYVDKNTGTQTETVGDNTYNFLEVALPWSKAIKSSNLPMDFCDDILPANGWELVMNSCGSTAAQNLNYFALYNKYTGILRIFTFVPTTFNVSTANDHAWEVTLSRDLAQHLNMKFGLPMADQIVDKALIGMDKGTDYSWYVTPYVSSASSDQKVTPNPGWWAFDIDLSLYREGFTTLNQELRLQMRAWNEDQVTLNSNINAQIKEKQYPPTFGLNSITGIVGHAKEGYSAVSSLIDNVVNLATGNWGESLLSLIGIAESGYGAVMGIKGELSKIGASGEPYYVTTQYIDGTISTNGLNKGSRAVSGIYSPTFSLNEFYVENSMLGQGVWNLRHAPIVYQFDKGYTNQSANHHPNPRVHVVNCAFDPTSVEVVLNPRLFNTDNVEYMEVKSVCGVSTSLKHDGNDNYRKAFGMKANETLWEYPGLKYYGDKDNDLLNVKYDSQADYAQENQTGRFPVSIKDYEKDGDTSYELYGRGDEKYLIEPNYIQRWATGTVQRMPRIPCYEVTVSVVVKLKGVEAPLNYTRKYLPEIKQFYSGDSKANFEQMEAQLEKFKNDPMQKGHTGLMEAQLQHFKNIILFDRPEFESQEAFYLTGNSGYTYLSKLFDGNPNTNLRHGYENKKNGEWVYEFTASRPITPKRYAMTTATDCVNFKGSTNPKRWGLYAKSADGSWVLLDWRDAGENANERLPVLDAARKMYDCRFNLGTYKEFKLVIPAAFTAENALTIMFTSDSGFLSLAEFEMFEEDADFTCENSSGGEPSGYGGQNLIDGDYGTEWHSTNRVDGKWFVEFKASHAISPKTYFFISGTDSGWHADRTPAAWKLYGKKNAGDEWTLLSDLDIDRDGGDAYVPGTNVQKSYVFDFNIERPQNMQYFRLEISRSFGSDAVQLNEMVFNY